MESSAPVVPEPRGRGELLVQHPPTPTPQPAAVVAPKEPPRRRRRGRIIGAAALLVLLGGAGAAFAVWNYNNAAPVRAVEQFLAALADGDLKTLNSFVRTDADTSLLTQEVLDASRELAPIRTIDVVNNDGVVKASFSVGSTDVTRTFDVKRNGEGWLITDALTAAPALADFTGTNVRVNGVPIPDEDAVVFPGSYELTLDSTDFEFYGETEFVIASDTDAAAIEATNLVLSETGVKTFIQLVSASLTECLVMTGATTPCGIDVDPARAQGPFIEGTAQRALKAEDQAAFANLPVTQLYGEITTVRAARGLTVDLTFRSEDGDDQGEYTSQSYQLWPQVDFAVEPLQVSWTY